MDYSTWTRADLEAEARRRGWTRTSIRQWGRPPTPGEKTKYPESGEVLDDTVVVVCNNLAYNTTVADPRMQTKGCATHREALVVALRLYDDLLAEEAQEPNPSEPTMDTPIAPESGLPITAETVDRLRAEVEELRAARATAIETGDSLTACEGPGRTPYRRRENTVTATVNWLPQEEGQRFGCSDAEGKVYFGYVHNIYTATGRIPYVLCTRNDSPAAFLVTEIRDKEKTNAYFEVILQALEQDGLVF